MSRRTQPPRLSIAPPAAAEEGSAQVRALLVPLFGRHGGSGADWSLMLESLFRAGFQITDGRPDDEARRFLLRRVHEGSYSRLAGNSDRRSGPFTLEYRRFQVIPVAPAEVGASWI